MMPGKHPELIMKILVTGAAGQLGRELRNVLEERRPGVTTYIDIDDVDLTDEAATEKFLRDGNFSHIINCAAYTAVDKAEEDSGLCTAVNVDAVRNLAKVAADTGARILHISTDYVFDGRSFHAYTESDKPAPASHYGATKRRSETALIGLLPDSIIVRTGWLYSPYGRNFVKTIASRCTPGAVLRVVDDQIGTPTYARDLAEMLTGIVLAPQWLPGIYHYSNEGVTSWYDFAVAIRDLSGHSDDVTVRPVPSSDYPTPAARPPFSVLNKAKIKITYGVTIPHWSESLKKCMARIASGEGR